VKTQTTNFRRTLTGVLTVALLCVAGRSLSQESGASPSDLAQRIFAETGISGGLVVHLGCGDGKLTAALHANDSYLVHGLDVDTANVAKAREHIRSRRLNCAVSVDKFDGKRLPYADNLVNLVVASDQCQVPSEEILRVLVPGGVSLALDSRLSTLDSSRKPWPDDIDQWSHFLHDASNNAVAQDARVGPPRRL